MRVLDQTELAAISGGDQPQASWPAREIPLGDPTFLDDVFRTLQAQSEQAFIDWVRRLTTDDAAA